MTATVQPMDCPDWCTIGHDFEDEVEHKGKIFGVALAAYPFVSGRELCHSSVLATLMRMPHDAEPSIVTVAHDGATEDRLTLAEAEELAKVLLGLVATARG